HREGHVAERRQRALHVRRELADRVCGVRRLLGPGWFDPVRVDLGHRLLLEVCTRLSMRKSARTVPDLPPAGARAYTVVRVSVSTLTEWLRERDDAALARLLGARPDLATPIPADTSVLATRAGSRASVARAAESLDTFTLTVLDALLLRDADTRTVTLAE